MLFLIFVALLPGVSCFSFRPDVGVDVNVEVNDDEEASGLTVTVHRLGGEEVLRLPISRETATVGEVLRSVSPCGGTIVSADASGEFASKPLGQLPPDTLFKKVAPKSVLHCITT